MKRAGRTRIGTQDWCTGYARRPGVISATEKLLGDAGDTGQAEQAEILRVALIAELGKLGEMVTENQLKSIGAPLGI